MDTSLRVRAASTGTLGRRRVARGRVVGWRVSLRWRGGCRGWTENDPDGGFLRVVDVHGTGEAV